MTHNARFARGADDSSLHTRDSHTTTYEAIRRRLAAKVFRDCRVTIPIVHTHPVAYPRPSEQDKLEATRLGIPIYVLSIEGVYKAVPGAERETTIVKRQAWIRQVPNKAPSGLAAAAP